MEGPKTSGKIYVDNKAFFEAMVSYLNQKEDAEKNGTKLPKISNYIGECILKIATKLASLSNFNRYTYKEEMISDAVEKCIMYIHNFDEATSKNPFAYFTTICYYSFMNRISLEKKQKYGQYKMMLQKVHYDNIYEFNDGSAGNGSDFINKMVDNSDLDVSSMELFVAEYEKKNLTKKQKMKKVKVRPQRISLEI